MRLAISTTRPVRMAAARDGCYGSPAKRRVEFDWLSWIFGVATIAGKAESAGQTSLVLKYQVNLKIFVNFI